MKVFENKSTSLPILVLIPIGAVFASESLISVQTDDNSYDEEDTILVSGNISTIIGETDVTLQLFHDGNLIDIAQIRVGADGNYSHTIIAQGPQWARDGEYVVKVTYGESNAAETSFQFSTKSQITETTDNLVVDAGDSGTFDIK